MGSAPPNPLPAMPTGEDFAANGAVRAAARPKGGVFGEQSDPGRAFWARRRVALPSGGNPAAGGGVRAAGRPKGRGFRRAAARPGGPSRRAAGAGVPGEAAPRNAAAALRGRGRPRKGRGKAVGIAAAGRALERAAGRRHRTGRRPPLPPAGRRRAGEVLRHPRGGG